MPALLTTMSQPSPTNQSSAASAAPVGKKKSANKNRAKARQQFDASAPIIPLERYFSDYQEIRRNNVDVELDPGLLDRMASPYMDKAADFATIRDLDPEVAGADLPRATHALVGFTMIRKLLKSAPASVKPSLHAFKFISDTEFFAPPALISAVDNLGKFSSDQFTIRNKYLEQDVVRNVFRVLKSMSAHTNFAGKYVAPPGMTWNDLDPERLVFPSEASARWIRDLGQTFLAETAYHSFPATVQINGVDVEIRATFPQLRISTNRETMLNNILAWIVNINPAMPNALLLIAAAIFTIWTPLYTERWAGATVALVEPRLADTPAGDLTLRQLLTAANVQVVTLRIHQAIRNDWVQFMTDVHNYVSAYGRTTFDKFLRLTKQPDTEFGSMAQLLELDPTAWSQVPARSAAHQYWNQRQDMSASTLIKLPNRGDVTSGLMFGFTKKVTYQNNLSARLNGSIQTTRLSYLASDFLNVQ